ncbi:translation initiation factor IF-2-like [Hemicordylus capensis]|uniref:translation initiation factor IF-2-like n=1 Tax=Hemicordylus capensis TaxID=884348 RepID=UPI0023041D76|nr:translation initiation factor IF-2-like [Hemicordylus capensis]
MVHTDWQQQFRVSDGSFASPTRSCCLAGTEAGRSVYMQSKKSRVGSSSSIPFLRSGAREMPPSLGRSPAAGDGGSSSASEPGGGGHPSRLVAACPSQAHVHPTGAGGLLPELGLRSPLRRHCPKPPPAGRGPNAEPSSAGPRRAGVGRGALCQRRDLCVGNSTTPLSGQKPRGPGRRGGDRGPLPKCPSGRKPARELGEKRRPAGTSRVPPQPSPTRRGFARLPSRRRNPLREGLNSSLPPSRRRPPLDLPGAQLPPPRETPGSSEATLPWLKTQRSDRAGEGQVAHPPAASQTGAALRLRRCDASKRPPARPAGSGKGRAVSPPRPARRRFPPRGTTGGGAGGPEERQDTPFQNKPTAPPGLFSWKRETGQPAQAQKHPRRGAGIHPDPGLRPP